MLASPRRPRAYARGSAQAPRVCSRLRAGPARMLASSAPLPLELCVLKRIETERAIEWRWTFASTKQMRISWGERYLGAAARMLATGEPRGANLVRHHWARAIRFPSNPLVIPWERGGSISGGRAGGRTDARAGGRTSGRAGGRADERTDQRTGGRTDGPTGGRTRGRAPPDDESYCPLGARALLLVVCV